MADGKPTPVPYSMLAIIAIMLITAIATVTEKQVVANAVILATADHSCDRPIHDWIAVVIALYATKAVLLVALAGCTAVQRRVTAQSTVASLIFLGMEIATIAWAIVGSVWLTDSSTCEASNSHPDASSAYSMTLATVIISYVVTGALLCCSACAACCICFGSRLMTEAKASS